jgi:heme oxygenase
VRALSFEQSKAGEQSQPGEQSQAGAARLKLRAATAPDHAAVDDAYSAFDLSRPADYRAFLEAQSACLEPLEDALTAAGAERLLADWRGRRRAPLLAADLAELGGARDAAARPAFTIALHEPAALLGALYVLEGSRFGGAVLARRLPAAAPARFLGAPSEPHAWRALVSAMDRHLGSEPALAAAVAAARAVFAAFEATARLRLEPALG